MFSLAFINTLSATSVVTRIDICIFLCIFLAPFAMSFSTSFCWHNFLLERLLRDSCSRQELLRLSKLIRLRILLSCLLPIIYVIGKCWSQREAAEPHTRSARHNRFGRIEHRLIPLPVPRTKRCYEILFPFR